YAARNRSRSASRSVRTLVSGRAATATPFMSGSGPDVSRADRGTRQLDAALVQLVEPVAREDDAAVGDDVRRPLLALGDLRTDDEAVGVGGPEGAVRPRARTRRLQR